MKKILQHFSQNEKNPFDFWINRSGKKKASGCLFFKRKRHVAR